MKPVFEPTARMSMVPMEETTIIILWNDTKIELTPNELL